jgi:hypothetical protein
MLRVCFLKRRAYNENKDSESFELQIYHSGKEEDPIILFATHRYYELFLISNI